MDTFRYVVAVIALVVYPAAVVFWFLVHPFVTWWRRAGVGATYVATLGGLAVLGTVLYRFRDACLDTEFGTHAPLLVAAALSYAAGGRIERQVRTQLSLRTLVGLPELRNEGPDTLLQDGIFSRVRHPRYVGAWFGLAGTALVANYLAIYLLAAAYIPAIYLLTRLEERELVDRFGDAYRAYQRRVPRLVPGRRSAHRTRGSSTSQF